MIPPGVIRTLAFVRKEAAEVVRQPRLLVALVIGPFLVLAVFGAGLRETDPPVRTVFVAPPESAFTGEVLQFAEAQAERLIVEGVIEDEEAALDDLRRGALELVVVFPADVEEQVRRNERATVTLYHTQLDPLEARAVELFMETAVHQINRMVVSTVVEEGQEDTEELHARVQDARRRTDALRVAVAARTATGEDIGVTTRDVDELASELALVDEGLTQFRETSPDIAVAPLEGDVVRLEGEGIELSDFYAPAVVAVLLQHMLVTFVALSLVREEELGTTQLYRVAPLRIGELVVGKYLAHTLLGALVAAALIALLMFGLAVPMVGSWVLLTLTVGALLLASAGLGLLVAVVSRSDSQAVQYSMMLLLATIFFSGFILSLDRFIPATRWVGYALPATYGVELMRGIMLRGTASEPWLLGALAAFGLLLGMASWLLLRRKLLRG